MVTSLFGDYQVSCLEDRREATVMIRMNRNWRMQEVTQLEEINLGSKFRRNGGRIAIDEVQWSKGGGRS